MKIPNFPSITKFQQLVELKNYRRPTKKEHVRYVRKLAEHFQCDPATLSENPVRQYFLFLRGHKHYSRSLMKMASITNAQGAVCRSKGPMAIHAWRLCKLKTKKTSPG